MNKTLTAVLLLALASSAAAQQKPQEKSPARKPAAAAAVQAKPVPEARPADPAAEILAHLKAWDAKLETLTADFTQEVDFTEAGLKQSIEGNLRYAKPNFLRIEHVKPSRQLIVTDKENIWIYKPGDKQAVRTKWEAWRRTQDQNFSGILDFGNYTALTARNETKVGGGKDGAPFTVTFTPRSGNGYSLTLTLSATDYFPTEAELSVEGTTIKTRLSKVEKNSKIDKKIFTFVPPKGTDILEFKN